MSLFSSVVVEELNNITAAFLHPQPLDGHIVKDPFFLAKLQIFRDVLNDFVYRFQNVLTAVRDSSFHVYGQTARFIHCLAVKCFDPEIVPETSDWEGLLALDVTKCAKITSEEFGVGSDFRDQLLSVRSSQTSDFLTQARDLYYDLLASFVSSVSNLMVFYKGLAAFDAGLFFREDTGLGSRMLHFSFYCFSAARWFQPRDKSPCIAEYLGFISELRQCHVDSSGRLLPIVMLSSCYPVMMCS